MLTSIRQPQTEATSANQCMPYTCTNEKLARMGASGASNARVYLKNALRVTSTEEIRPAINTTCNGRIGASHAHAANLAHPRPALRRCLGRAPMNTDRGRGGRDQRATAAPRGRGGGARPRNLLDGEFGNSGHNRGLGSLFEPPRVRHHVAWLRRRIVRSCVGDRLCRVPRVGSRRCGLCQYLQKRQIVMRVMGCCWWSWIE